MINFKTIYLHCIFGDTTLKPVLIQFITGFIDRHSSFKIINTAKKGQGQRKLNSDKIQTFALNKGYHYFKILK